MNSFEREHRQMLEAHLKARDINDRRVLKAMAKVPRHEFVEPTLRELSYEDNPLPIGEGQTISQPYIVAYMCQAARLKESDRVLEVGLGCGYEAAVLAEIVQKVFAIEILPALYTQAVDTLARLNYKNIETKLGDGYEGWPEMAPFQAILMAAATEELPAPLLRQLDLGGRLIYPRGKPQGVQELVRLTKGKKGVDLEVLTQVRFVPMTGRAELEGVKS